MKTQITSFILGLSLLLFGCAICASACSSQIINQTSHNIVIIVKPAAIKNGNYFSPFAEASQVFKFKIDTIRNTTTFIIPPGRHLITYDGPGSNPAKLLIYLKIVTQKQILEFNTQDEINRTFEKSGVLYTLVVK